jgi:parallel beta-helix repeat protein
VAAPTTQIRTVTSISTQTKTQLPTDTLTPSPTSSATQLAPTAVPTIGRTIVVNSNADSGPGTLRQALLDAHSGDMIMFDPAIFPPQAPARIILANCLPEVLQDHLTIDASGAGVILDGSHIEAEWCSGIRIISTNWNTIQDLRFEGFSPGAGVEVAGGAQHNLVKDNIVGFGDVGFVLGGKETSSNKFTGNFIGVDYEGKSLEQTSVGIYIEDGASHNTIAGNTIAYNSHGIEIVDSDSVGNTISQNSIYGNLRNGIGLEAFDQHGGGNSGLHTPTIIEFDIEKGMITGFTCPNCLIEIFSDERNQGRIFEGQLTADSAGNFSLKRTAPFTGPHLTATATDKYGTTSPFSVPTSGSHKRIIFQDENDLPITKFQTKALEERMNNRIGGDIGNWIFVEGQDNEDLYNNLLSRIHDLGVSWVRTGFWSPNPLTWQEVLIEPGIHQIPHDVDDFVTELADEGINIVLTLSVGAGLNDRELGCHGGSGRGVLGDSEPDGWFKTQEERDKYIDYARFMAQHFKSRIKYYELWNEPNDDKEITGGCYGGVSSDDYVTLVKEVAPVIHQIDPDAKIVVGSNLFDEYDRWWLLEMLKSGLASVADVISWHPFYGESPALPSDECYRDPLYWEQYPSNVEYVIRQARSMGYLGTYMVVEMVWRTPTDFVPQECPFYTDIQAAKYAARANIIHLGMDFEMVSNQILMPNTIQPLPRYYTIRNLSTVMDEAEPYDLPFEIQSEATKIKSYVFSSSNDDYLLAFWTDVGAVDNDPGVPATLTIPNFYAEKVTGIDVLHGFEQELITSTENGNLVIRDLLVKDYPLILRLSRWTR